MPSPTLSSRCTSSCGKAIVIPESLSARQPGAQCEDATCRKHRSQPDTEQVQSHFETNDPNNQFRNGSVSLSRLVAFRSQAFEKSRSSFAGNPRKQQCCQNNRYDPEQRADRCLRVADAEQRPTEHVIYCVQSFPVSAIDSCCFCA
jgi:hypothetical protein